MEKLDVGGIRKQFEVNALAPLHIADRPRGRPAPVRSAHAYGMNAPPEPILCSVHWLKGAFTPPKNSWTYPSAPMKKT